MADSKGDPRILFVLNLVLSTAFALLVVWGLSFIGMLAFDWVTVAVAAVLLMVVTYLVVW